MEHHSFPTLVLGGTGKTGARVVHRLRERNLPVRIGSRAADPPFDWDDRSTWARVLEGAGAAYLSYSPDLAAPGPREAVAAFTEAALEHAVRRLVLLSGRGEEEAWRAEQALQASGADWTVVRCSWFMQNFSESFFLDSLLAGVVALPDGGMAEPFADADDIADVAVAALTEDGHRGRVYEVTGPRLLTFADAVAEIGRAAERPIRYEPASIDEHAAELTRHGVPADVVGFLGYLFGEVLDGRNAWLGDGVQRALGRPPRDFAEYARDAASSGVWAAAASAAAST